MALYSARRGEHSLLWLMAAAVGVTAHRGRRGVYLSCGRTVVAGEVLNAMAKALVGRRRPSIGHLPPLTAARSQLSHPSAHATTSFAAAAVLSRALPPVIPYSLAAGMALSRPTWASTIRRTSSWAVPSGWRWRE